MKATIVHESRGRMRLRLNIPRLSVADADRLELWLAGHPEITDVKVIIPPLRLCGDNAGMIAYASVSEWNKENFAGWDLNAKPSLAFEGIE